MTGPGFAGTRPGSPTAGRRRAVVLGGRGFVGAAICAELEAEGWLVDSPPAARLVTSARTVGQVAGCLPDHSDLLTALASTFRGAAAVVNAAGLAQPAGRDGDALFGANALLPLLVARACERAGVNRVVHVSSAAVQGATALLDEEDRYLDVSLYARSKALGEQCLLEASGALESSGVGVTVFRPTSVHGPRRRLTRRLAHLACSRLACVAAPGRAPTSQVLIGNVGGVAADLCAMRASPPPIVLQPWEGWTTSTFLHRLSERWPAQLPPIVASLAIDGTARMTRLAPVIAAHHRRLELLWRGQAQVPGWLRAHGYHPRYGAPAWDELVAALREPAVA